MENSYDKIDNPYGKDLIRSSSPMSSNDRAVSFADGKGKGNSDTSGDETHDLWVDSFIRSRNFYPKKRGFDLDGASGIIRATQFQAGDFHMDGNNGLYFGSSPLDSTFSIYPSGKIVAKNIQDVSEWLAGEVLNKNDIVFIADDGRAYKAGALTQVLADITLGFVIDSPDMNGTGTVQVGKTVRVASSGTIQISDVFGFLNGHTHYLSEGDSMVSQANVGTTWNVWGTDWYAQTFSYTSATYPQFPLISFKLRMQAAGVLTTGADYLYVDLYTVTGGEPDELIAQTEYPNPTWEERQPQVAGADDYVINFFDDIPQLKTGVNYALVFSGTGDAVNHHQIIGVSPSAYAGGALRYSADSGVTWGNPGTQGDAAFDIYRYEGRPIYDYEATPTVEKKVGFTINNGMRRIQL